VTLVTLKQLLQPRALASAEHVHSTTKGVSPMPAYNHIGGGSSPAGSVWGPSPFVSALFPGGLRSVHPGIWETATGWKDWRWQIDLGKSLQRRV
jgi:hypothetical protein